MFLIASLLVLAFGVYAYVFLRIAVLERVPWPIFAVFLASAALALVQIVRPGKLWLRIVSGLPILLSAFFIFTVLFLSVYAKDRPSGPAVGGTFPELTMERASDGTPIVVGRSGAKDRLQLLVLFRGFW